MDRKEFKAKVLQKLQSYSRGRTKQELIKAMNEYSDLVEEGYTHYRGIEYGCDYAAWNISQCV